MDLGKGGRWAKLMDEHPEEKSVIAIKNENSKTSKSVETESTPGMNIDELKTALKRIKNEEIQDSMTDKEQKIIKDKYRSMEEIKAAFDELHLQQETDFQVMERLLSKYRDENTLLEEMVDNAVDFLKLNGMDTMVKSLNSSKPEIRIEAAHVIGSAVQSNPSVQVKAVEAGALSSLIKIVSDVKERDEARRKALYALSCLIRHFPAAQYLFRNAGGFTALTNCANKHGSEKLRYRAISLINDLVVERKEQFSSLSVTEENKEKERQYRLFALSDEIKQMRLCSIISRSLQSTTEHDQREILVTVMRNVHNICQEDPTYAVGVENALQEYKNIYRLLADEEELDGDFDSYFHSIYKDVSDLLTLVTVDRSSASHNEL